MTIDPNEGVKYATKVWLTGVIGGPIILFLYSAIDELNDLEFLLGWVPLLLVMFLYSLVFSMPSWILICLCVTRVNRLSWSVFAKKCLLFGIATLLTLLPLAIFAGADFWNREDWLIVLPYWLSITFAVFYFKLQTPEPQVPILPLDETS